MLWFNGVLERDRAAFAAVATVGHLGRVCLGDSELAMYFCSSTTSFAVASRTEAIKLKDLARVVVDTTVQPKAVMFPTDPSC